MRVSLQTFSSNRILFVLGLLWLAFAALVGAQEDPDALPPIQDPHPMPDVRQFTQSLLWKEGAAWASFASARWDAAPEQDAKMTGVAIHYRVNGGATRTVRLAGSLGSYAAALPGIAATDSVAWFYVQELKGSIGPIRVNTSWFGRRLNRAPEDPSREPRLQEPRVFTFASRFRDRHEDEWLYDQYVAGYTDSTYFFVTVKDYGTKQEWTMETQKPSLFATMAFYDFGGLTPGYDLTRIPAGGGCERFTTKGVTGIPEYPEHADRGFTRFRWTLEPVVPGQQVGVEYVFRIRKPDGRYQAYYTENIRYYGGAGFQPAEQHPYANANGPLSINNVSYPRFAFNQHLLGPEPKTLLRFLAGKTLFDTDWEHGRIMNPQTPNGCEIPHEKGELRLDYMTPATPIPTAYLGPRFNNTSCTHCHFMDGRGSPDPIKDVPFKTMLMRLSAPGTDAHGGPKPHPVYGTQLQEFAGPGAAPEGKASVTYEVLPSAVPGVTLAKPTYAFSGLTGGPIDGSMVLFSPRVAPQVPGLGLLAGVSDDEMLRLAADQAAAGRVSGKPNRVWDVAANGLRLGRFGWKAGQPTLRQQAAAAAANDIGLSNPVFPDSNGAAELDGAAIDKLVDYLGNLALPPRTNWADVDAIAGKALFERAQCGDCHTPVLTTTMAGYDIPYKTFPIQPFTDLLLHDMGPGLSDGRAEFEAGPQEWRTPPLWGVGLIEEVSLHTRYLHDGRARNLLEAVLWHGGEGEPSRRAVEAMTEAERRQLIAYVKYPFADVPATTPPGAAPSAASVRPGPRAPPGVPAARSVTLYVQGMGAVFRGDASEAAAVRILAPSGRLIREIPVRGERVFWDRKDGRGRMAGNGLYLIQVERADRRSMAVGKVALHP
jgi:CxxC motif-containing protein (DUF1111 family)